MIAKMATNTFLDSMLGPSGSCLLLLGISVGHQKGGGRHESHWDQYHKC